MNMPIVWLLSATGTFVGSHFLLSHPLRAPLVKAFGLKVFQTLYSLIAIVLLVWTIVKFGAAPRQPLLWDGHTLVPWIIASLLTLTALALFLASLTGNPALPGARVAGLSAVLPRGVYKITRHPMMFAFVLWAVAHIIVAPSPRSLVFCGGIIALALGGARLQDIKKEKLYGRDWRSWLKRTTYWPNLGKATELGWYWGVAVLPWLLITWLHMTLAHEPASIWRAIVAPGY